VGGAEFFSGGQRLKHPVMSFGSLCPGKRYALLQLKCFLLAMLSRYRLRYATDATHAADAKIPDYDARYHGHEVLPPVHDVNIQFQTRHSPRQLLLVQE